MNYFDYKTDSKCEKFTKPLMWDPPQEMVKEPIKKLVECDNFFLEKLDWGKERNPNLTHQEIKALNKL